MKIKFNSQNEFPLEKTVKMLTITLVVWAIFLENDKYYPQVYYPQVFLGECLYKI